MEILTISGSIKAGSSNQRLLAAIARQFEQHSFAAYQLTAIPAFHPDQDSNPLPKEVLEWRQAISNAEAVIVSTPEYIHNIPAVLKNALEWIASSGELVGKPVIAITYTPNAPRGEKAMQSLLWSLQALDGKVVVSLQLYQNELMVNEEGKLQGAESLNLIEAALEIL